jgi:hypothetical protein
MNLKAINDKFKPERKFKKSRGEVCEFWALTLITPERSAPFLIVINAYRGTWNQVDPDKWKTEYFETWTEAENDLVRYLFDIISFIRSSQRKNETKKPKIR